jgi:hypothetical protein
MLINSAFYEDLADHVILNHTDLNNIISSYALYKSDCIIYCKTDYVEHLFNHLLLSNRKYVLITHHSDYSIDNKLHLKPKNITKWYGINLSTYNEDSISIPIGTKTPQGRAYHEPQYDINWLESNYKELSGISKNLLKVYCNWTITNKDRMNIVDNLNVDYYVSGSLPFKDYCLDMARYKFVISPPGNGLDNHRTWEALYLGCIPIVIKNSMYDSWKELPILQVNDYKELTYSMVNEFLLKSYNYEKISTEYWKHIITNK